MPGVSAFPAMSSSPFGAVSVPFGLDAVFHELFFYQLVKFYDASNT
jgi:hypothetical protein